MTNTLAAHYVTSLPKVQVAQLAQLQWAIEQAKLSLGEAACNTAAAWKMFDDAVEDGDKEAKNDLAELAAFCESVQSLAHKDLDELEAQYLALMS